MTLTRATLVWCLVGTMATMTIVSFALTGLSVDLRSNRWLPLAIAGLMSASVFYRYRRPNPHLCSVTEAAAQMLLILLFGILLTYAAMTTNFPTATPSYTRSTRLLVSTVVPISISSTTVLCWPSLQVTPTCRCCRSSRWCQWCS